MLRVEVPQGKGSLCNKIYIKMYLRFSLPPCLFFHMLQHVSYSTEGLLDTVART